MRSVLLWIILLAAGFGLRAYDLGRAVYWTDEVSTSLIISGYPWEEVRAQLGDREFGPSEALRFQRPSPERDTAHTLRTLANFDPHHAPLYFIVVRAWASLAGYTPGAIRWFSVVGGLLVIPLFFVLAAELFASRRAGWLAAGLAVVSPFHVIYAREARPYAWLTVMVLASSVLLLKALRRGSVLRWAAYAACVAAGLNLHLVFAAVVAAHLAWVFAHAWKKLAAPKQIPRAMAPYALATALACATAIPWLLVLRAHWSTASSQLTWIAKPVGILRLVGMWAFNYSALFFDTDISIFYLDHISTSVVLAYGLRTCLLVVALATLGYLWRTAEHMSAAFVLSLVVLPFLALALPDVLFGGWRSGGGSRYLLASYVGMGLAMAHTLAHLLSTRRRLGAAFLALVLASCGLYSSFRFVRADSWWAKGADYFTPGVIRRINQAESPLVYARIGNNLMTLAHGLRAEVRFRAMADANGFEVAPATGMDVFVYRPTRQQSDALRLRFSDAFQCVDSKGDLWQLLARP